MKLLRPLLAVLAVATVFTMVIADADARPRVSMGSRGSKTFSAPPSTATAPNAAAPINRTMTQPGSPGMAAPGARPPITQPGGFGRGLMGGLLGGLLAPEYFLFPLGLFYMTFGLARATVLGLMERPEPVAIVDERLVDAHDTALPPPLSHERRGRWGDRRQEPDDL